MKGIVFDIKRFSINDGPGIRTTIFLKGCPLNCWWCHNPESQETDAEVDIKKMVLDGITFEKRQPVGVLMTVDEVMKEVIKESVFYDESGGGVTFSGGEPMIQVNFLSGLLKASKEKGFHTAIDTCGYAPTKNFDMILKYTDLFLFDLKHTDDDDHIKYTGVSNVLILENLRFLADNNADIIIRIPVIPGINNNDEEIHQMIDLLTTFNGKFKDIHLLPFHSHAANKYNRFRKMNRLTGLKSLNKSDLIPIKDTFASAGFNVVIGG